METYLAAVSDSRPFHRPWVSPPDDEEAFLTYVARNRGLDFEALLACRVEDGALIGVFNLSQIFRGTFQNAYLGYWVSREFAARGYMTEAMRAVLSHAFTGLRLHRIEANIQPKNERSVALVKRSGFRLEGFSPRYLKIMGRWRDHKRWAITKEDWLAQKARENG